VKRVSTDPELTAPADSRQVFGVSNKESKDSTDVDGHEEYLIG
jgi:hypothetical protein